ncbi:hypothetical protein LEP1GSC173_3547 [Leptospira interrogans str. HAI1594]|nr:hypothetical protein LEP1GSC117_0659 [Leptospira interrogans serovar Icterohaemorrhagiae str. Verdun LP]EKP78176.1 hypothetical protein LEP1GSC173_3547 [Leptospira interrogans str. HAI1594]EKR24728.1 hypothetical protein LEP1GSC087_1893 [Leptospira interrogans serovar Bataviae str. L1111]EMF72002.1 hypothetical protein LEP1GSC148_2748 [Leptospira interrogans serovar Canicola str. LT1962]EMJ46902.1 hypothetical protein LEP1GSC111_2799 [Leptospira interrogans str. UT126]EMM92860.1 hypothetica
MPNACRKGFLHTFKLLPHFPCVQFFFDRFFRTILFKLF